MKKFLAILMSIFILSIGFVIPSYAQSSVSVNIPVTSNTVSTIEISGTSNLPEPASVSIENTYTYTLTFDTMGTYKYKIKQVPNTNDGIIYDTTIYDVEVLVVDEDGLKGYVSIYKEGETVKQEVIAFSNTIKDKTTNISITKANKTGDPLEGAHLVLINKGDSTEIAKWESTKEAKEFILNDGEYTLHEESAPKGYLKVDNFDFSIEEGKINLTETENVTLEGNNIIVKDPEEVIEPEPVPTPDPKPEPTPTKTGDDTHLLLYVISLIGSIVLIGIILIRRRKHAKNL